jgi:hypothetical protein
MATTTTTPTSRVVADEVLARLGRMRQSRVWLSAATGIPLTTLTRRLNAQSAFTIDELDIIATALGTGLVDLIAASAPPGVAAA